MLKLAFTTAHVSTSAVSYSKLTLHLASRGPTRFITDTGSLVQPSAKSYQHSPTAAVHATQRTSM